MRKMLLFVLCFVLLFSLISCSTGDNTEADDNAITDLGDRESMHFEEDADPISNHNDTKQKMIDTYGTPFTFYRAFDMELITIDFYEASAEREHHDSMKDYVDKHTSSWDIVGGELVITGEWNETFTLDFEANTAISKTDGAEYRIVKADED